MTITIFSDFFFFSSCIFPSSSSSEAPSVDTTAPVVGVPSESTGQASTGIVPPDAPQLFFQQTNGIHVSKRCLGSVQATVPSSMYDFNDDPTSERYEMIITTVITMCNKFLSSFAYTKSFLLVSLLQLQLEGGRTQQGLHNRHGQSNPLLLEMVGENHPNESKRQSTFSKLTLSDIINIYIYIVNK